MIPMISLEQGMILGLILAKKNCKDLSLFTRFALTETYFAYLLRTAKQYFHFFNDRFQLPIKDIVAPPKGTFKRCSSDKANFETS